MTRVCARLEVEIWIGRLTPVERAQRVSASEMQSCWIDKSSGQSEGARRPGLVKGYSGLRFAI